MTSNLRRPIVTNIDREWAMSLMPDWCVRGGDVSEGEVIDDGGCLDDDTDDASPVLRRGTTMPPPNWSIFVLEQIELFEQHYNGEYKSYAAWSTLWRTIWWPNIDPVRRFPKSAPREFQPFFRNDTPEFSRAIEVATPQERKMWMQFGVAQFKPDDPRLSRVRGP